MTDFVPSRDVLTALRENPEAFTFGCGTHPGVLLKREWLDPLGVTVNAAAKAMAIPASRLDQITKGKRSITADTALRLGCFFGVSAETWMNLQRTYDLEEETAHAGRAILAEVQPLHSEKTETSSAA
jgi:addiction module HigA family antidote